MTQNLELAVIGNCSINALIDEAGSITWACFPRFDADPTFCSLLNGGSQAKHGFFDILMNAKTSSKQAYVSNTAIASTEITDENRQVLEIIDFAPRFEQFGRMFRPTSLVRKIRPIKGIPQICIRLRPCSEYGAMLPTKTLGSNHIRFSLSNITLRLTTNAPITYINEEVWFALEDEITLILGPDESITEPVSSLGQEFLDKTKAYWRNWCRGLSIPFEWQDAVIRAAITLKLSSFEDTGAIIAAPTTSIPEAPGSERNWDYRFCWLRDSYFVVKALNSLGATETMEDYLSYISNIVATAGSDDLQPLFGINLEKVITEEVKQNLIGYNSTGPVRIGNDAFKQVQNDGYGSVILSCAQIFFDKRIKTPYSEKLVQNLEYLGGKASVKWCEPDAGLWELRTRAEVHTFSSVMCWAACDRLAKIFEQLGQPSKQAHWQRKAATIRRETLQQAWNRDLDSFTDVFGGDSVDASLLLLPELGFIKATDPKFKTTFKLIESELLNGSYLKRYHRPDDFGKPQTSFNICTFWYINALEALGRHNEARGLFENMLEKRTKLGLLSEDIDLETKKLWGNFPQTYSMVGIIMSASKLSKSWEKAF